MEKPTTMQELIEGMDALAMELDWKAEEFNGVLYLMHDRGATAYNMFGHGRALSTALFQMMVQDERFRAVVIRAHDAYVEYSAHKVAPSLEPLIKQLEKLPRVVDGGVAELAPCVCAVKPKMTS